MKSRGNAHLRIVLPSDTALFMMSYSSIANLLLLCGTSNMSLMTQAILIPIIVLKIKTVDVTPYLI